MCTLFVCMHSMTLIIFTTNAYKQRDDGSSRAEHIHVRKKRQKHTICDDEQQKKDRRLNEMAADTKREGKELPPTYCASQI